MWSIVSSMKLLRKPSKRGEGDIERNKGSTASLKEHSKEISHLDSDIQVNLDPSCSTESSSSANHAASANIGKSATLGSTGATGSGTSGTTKVKVERRESARLASSATKFLRSLRNHSGSGKIVASSVIAADDKHPINVIALKELDIETHSLNPGAAATSTTGGLSSIRSGSAAPGSSSSGKLPERSQSFNEKRLLVVTQNTSSENSGSSAGKTGSSGQVKVKHSRAQSFVCNNSSSRNKSGYSIYLNHHQHQYQSAQQNQANIVKQQMLFDHKHQKSGAGGDNNLKSPLQNSLQSGASSSNINGKSKVDSSLKNSTDSNKSSGALSSSPRALQSCETIYENLEVILEEKQNKEHMTNKSNIPCNKDYKLSSFGAHSHGGTGNAPIASKRTIGKSDNKNDPLDDRTIEKCSEGGNNLKVTKTTSSSSESLEANMRISGKDRSSPKVRTYNKDSGYETSCSDYSNLPKSTSVDSMVNNVRVDKSYSSSPGGGTMEQHKKSNRILNTSLYEELNISPIGENGSPSTSKKSQNGANPTSGSRKLRRSISEVPAERCTNLAKLQTKVGDSTARAMYTIANGLAVWTTEKCNSSLGLNAGNNSGSTQTLHQYQNIYGCRPHSQILHPQSVAPIPGGFSAAIQQASVYSTLPRNHASINSASSNDSFYRGSFQYQNVHQPVSSQQSHNVSSSSYHHYHQITAKSTPSVRNAVLQEHQVQKNCFGEPNLNLESSSSSPSSTTATHTETQHPIYQTIPIPTLSPARSTPNLGSSNKLLQPRLIQQQHMQGSIPHLSTAPNQQQVNDLGKAYPNTSSHHTSHQKLYNHHHNLSSSSVQLQQLHSTNDNVFGEPGRYPSTPNLQKCDNSSSKDAGYPESQYQCNLSSEGVDVDKSTSTNTSNIVNSGAMSSSNEHHSVGAANNIGGNWNSVDVQTILNNNNNNSAPARDPSSLKQIRYGPGHEKYPSWPIPVSSAQQIDPAGDSHPVKLVGGSGSTRSKSWTEQTDYPKEKTPSYARPYMKRVNHSYTQQLKTVMEKCERIPPEAFTSQNIDPQQLQLLHSHVSHPGGHRSNNHLHHPHLSKNHEGGIVPPPLLYRDLMCSQQNGSSMVGYPHHPNLLPYYLPSQQHPGQQKSGLMCEKDYPERENTVSKPLTQEDLELYTKKYEELMTQYPQSEGYHSYISSDSSSYISSGTPFLDQLRRESENNQQFWTDDKSVNNPNGPGIACDPNDPLFGLVGGQLATAAVSGRESVTTVVTNSSSNSSGNDTLKWHGSTSDICSLASGVGGGSMHSSGANTILTSSLKQNSINPIGKDITATSSANMLSSKGSWGEQKVHSSRLPTPQQQHAASPEVTPQNLRMEHQNGSSPLNKWHSGSGEITGGDHQTNNKHSNSISNSSNQPNLKKFPLNTYTRPNMLLVGKSNSSSQGSGSSSSNHSGNSSSATSTPEKMAKLLQSLNTDTVNAMNLKGAKSLSHSLSSPVIDTSKPPSVAERILELEQQQQQSHQQNSPSASGTSSPKMGHNQNHHHSNEHLAFLANSFMKSSSLNNLPNSPASLYTDESNGQSQQQNNEWVQGSRANTMSSPRGFMQSLSTSTVNKVVSSDPNNSNNNNAYGYLDTDKKHKVADMTLKAIQKKALLSYYERHKGKCANTSSASSVSSSEGNSSQADGPSLEKDLCFPGKSNRLMLSLPKDHSVASVDHPHLQNNCDMNSSRSGTLNSNSSSGNSTLSTSPSLTGLNRGYRTKSTSSSGVSSSSSSSSRSSSASNYKVSSQSQQHQFVHGSNSHNISMQKPLQSSILTTGLPEDNSKQVEKSEGKQSTVSNSTTPDESLDVFQGSESARLAYMSKYLPHLVNRDSNSTTSPGWSGVSSTKLPQGGTGGSSTVTQEPAPTPPERPPKKPHLRNLAQQVHEDNKDAKPPPPLPRAPVRPPASLNSNGAAGKGASGPPPIPSKPVMNSGGIGITRSPSPDELPPPPPPPPTEEMEVLINDEPLPPPPTVSEVDVIFGSRSRSVTGLSSCLHKDSYMAQRKERTLGYEGRYRRTLSPSGLGSNNGSKSSLESASPGGSDSLGSGRCVAGNTGTGKQDTTLSPAAWEKFHNIRPPSTTVIFTSNELPKGVSSPPSSSSPSTSGSPQPPAAQTHFHRSISCDSNIFNNKTGVSQSTIPPPIAQVAPLRGSSNNCDAVAAEPEKYSHAAFRPDVIPLSPSNMFSHSVKPCDNVNDSCSPDAGDHLNGDSSEFFSERDHQKPERKFGDKQETVARSISFSNSNLPSVIVPPLRYEKYDARSGGLSLNPNYSSEGNSLSALKKSEVSLRINCTSVVELQSMNGSGSNEEKNFATPPSFCNDFATSQNNADEYVHSKGSIPSSALLASNSTASFYTGRQKTQEELECEELSRDIAKLLPQGDKLQTLLVPLPDHKTTADYMEGLFHLELKLQPESNERRGSLSNGLPMEKSTQDLIEESAIDVKANVTGEESANENTATSSNNLEVKENGLPRANGDYRYENNEHSIVTPKQPVNDFNKVKAMGSNEKIPPNIPASYRRCNGHAPLPADSAYFTTSESKAKFLTQYNKDIKKEPVSGADSEELDKQKEELVSRISRKLEILRTEQTDLREEIQSNEQLGQTVVERVKQTAKRNEFDKFKLHVEEIEKITSLLLGISGRLARAENALMGLSDPPNPQEKKILESKRDKLREQLDEAKILKENIDRRSAQVSSFLQKYLTAEEYADYDHFVKMKAKLTIDAREIDDKIKLGEEQLGALKDALNTTFSPNTSSSA